MLWCCIPSDVYCNIHDADPHIFPNPISMYSVIMSAPFLFNTTEKNLPYILFYDNGDQVVPTHWHKELELSFIIKGVARLLVNDEMYEVHEGEAILINGGDTHFYFASTDHRRLVILVDLDIIEGSSSFVELKKELNSRLETNEKTCRCWSAEDKAELVEIIGRLAKLNDQNVFGRELLVRAMIFELLFLYSKDEYKVVEKRINYQTENKAMVKLQRVFNYIEQHYTEPITLTDIADEAGFNPSYFTRFFKSYTNVTFYDYLSNFRISKAQYLLVQKPDMSISMVAENVGFTSVKTFNRVFLKCVKIPPTKFRKVNK